MMFDQLTPHKLFCALLIREYALASHADSSVAEDECVPICDLTRVLVHEAVPESTSDVQLCFEPPLAQFADSVRTKLSRRSMQLVDQSIHKFMEIQSPDCIYDHVNQISQLCSSAGHAEGEATIGSSSPLGVYVRRLVLALSETSFDGLSVLFERVCAHQDQYRLQAVQRLSFAQPVANDRAQALRELKFQRSAEFVVAFAQNRAQTLCEQVDAISTDTQSHVAREISELDPSSCHLHYLDYLQLADQGDLHAALESLHRYFDRGTQSRLAASPDGASSKTFLQQTQYASLAVALLHFRFGNFRFCMQAVVECVHLSQQQHDSSCLLHALALLCRVALARGQYDVAQQMMVKCMQMAHQMYPLASAHASLPAQTVETPAAGQSASASIAVQMALLLAQSALNHVAQDSSSRRSNDATMNELFQSVQQMVSGSDIGSNALWSQFASVSQSIWQNLGNRYLAALHAEMFHITPSLKTTMVSDSADELKALCRSLAHAEPSDDCSRLFSAIFPSAVCTLPSRPTNSSMLAFDSDMPLKTLISTMQHHLDCANALDCRLVADKLVSMIPAISDSAHASWKSEWYLRARVLLARFALLTGDSNRALLEVKTLESICEANGHQHLAIEIDVLALMVEIRLRSTQPTFALSALMSATSLSQHLNLDQHTAALAIRIAELHLHLSSPRLAVILMRRWLPFVVEHGSTFLKVRLYTTLVKALLVEAHTSEGVLLECRALLDRAAKWSQVVCNVMCERDICYLGALVSDSLAQLVERDQFAARFALCDQLLAARRSTGIY